MHAIEILTMIYYFLSFCFSVLEFKFNQLHLYTHNCINRILMMNLEKYKHIFGEPGKGSHESRFLGMARNDLLLTIIGAIAIGHYNNVSFIFVFIVLFVLGTLLHMLFGVETAVVKMIKKIP